jgi:hypothetical protein
MESEEDKPTTTDGQIHLIRGVSVMLDVDLANLYGVTPGAFMQGVRRNLRRFPPDFLFQFQNQGLTILKSQSVISNSGRLRGGRRYVEPVTVRDEFARDTLTTYGSAV